MANPATFEQLVSDYELDHVSEHEDMAEFKAELPEGETFEHAYAHLDNGYSVSLLRTNSGGNKTIGYDDGLWEAVIVRENPNALGRLLGQDYVPAVEVNDVATEIIEGVGISGNLDNAGVNDLISRVASLSRYELNEDEQEGQVPGLEDLFDLLNGEDSGAHE